MTTPSTPPDEQSGNTEPVDIRPQKKKTRKKAKSQTPKPPDLTAPDPIDLSALWAPIPLAQTRHRILAIPASTRPPSDKFIQVLPFEIGDHNSEDPYVNCGAVYLFEYKFDREMSSRSYYVKQKTDVAQLLADRGRLKDAILVLGMVRLGGPFIWELKLPNGLNEMADKWAQSRLDVARRATTTWLKPIANTSASGYDCVEPTAAYDAPDWSKVDFNKAIEAACRGRVIDSLEHEAVKAALGL